MHKPGEDKIFRFLLFNDSEVGLHSGQVQRKTIEALIDDDKQSDEDILLHAQHVCQQDVRVAFECKAPLKNSRIYERSKFPDQFDRMGKFCDKRALDSLQKVVVRFSSVAISPNRPLL